MSDKNNMSWAIPVSVAQLGARLMTYVNSKATITTFKFAAAKAPDGSALLNVPPELLSIIIQQVRDKELERQIRWWIKMSRCVTKTYTASTHLNCSDMLNSTNAADEEYLDRKLGLTAEEAHEADVSGNFVVGSS